jgi:DNA (cytosine-5)-methyltransferase 1
MPEVLVPRISKSTGVTKARNSKNVDHPTHALSLFAGIGGIDLGLRLAVPSLRTVCYVEREAYCCAVLEARMADGVLDAAPIWTDVTTFDGRPWRGVVDCITGGFPCQDISNAGGRTGLNGEHSGLWFEYARIIREVGPRFVFVENVAALAVRGLDIVLGTLASLGFDAEWDVFSAAQVGAPHWRKRLFILAHSSSFVLAHSSSFAPPEPDNDVHETEPRPVTGGGGRGLVQEDGGVLGPFPPGPEERKRWATILAQRPDLAPAIERAVRRMVNGDAAWLHRLHALGNAVVPDVAALAWRILYQRLM